MEETRLLIPLVGMLLLTMVVWIYMYVRRISYMLENKIPAQSGQTSDKFHGLLPDSVNYSAHNFQNLFEMPVVFYTICLYLIWSGDVDGVHVICAYIFFVFRAIHSAIQCTFNHVMSRFIVYVISSVAVWVMVVRAALAI